MSGLALAHSSHLSCEVVEIAMCGSQLGVPRSGCEDRIPPPLIAYRPRPRSVEVAHYDQHTLVDLEGEVASPGFEIGRPAYVITR